MGATSLNWALGFAQPRNAEGEYDDDGHDNDASDDHDGGGHDDDKVRHNFFPDDKCWVKSIAADNM